MILELLHYHQEQDYNMSLVKVEGTSYYRDTKTMALINMDNSGREDYNFKKRLVNNQKEEINSIKSEINSIKSDMSEIKELIQQLLINKG